MSAIQTIEGDFASGQGRYTLVATRFNEFVVGSLVDGAADTLKRHGVPEASISLVRAPGAFELPLVVKKVAESRRSDAIIALGCVIRGGTPHFDYVAGECAKGVAQAALDHTLPVTFGILTVDTIEQAIERAGTKAGNKGGEAAMGALEMVSLFKQMDEG